MNFPYTCIQMYQRHSHLIIFSAVSKITIFIEIYELGWDKLYICLYGTFCYVTLLWIVDYRCFKIKVAFYHVLSNSIKVCHQNLCLLEYESKNVSIRDNIDHVHVKLVYEAVLWRRANNFPLKLSWNFNIHLMFFSMYKINECLQLLTFWNISLHIFLEIWVFSTAFAVFELQKWII